MQHPQLVSQCKRTRTMGNQQDSSAPLGEHAQRLQQSGFTCVVQMGVGFVEDNKVRLPVQRTSQRYALPLATGKRTPPFAHRGVIALRKVQHHLVQTSSLCRCHDLRSVQITVDSVKTRNVFRYRAGEKCCLLRQITHTQTAGPQLAAGQRPCTRQRACQGGLTRARRPQQHCEGAGLQREVKSVQDVLHTSRRGHTHAMRNNGTARPGDVSRAPFCSGSRIVRQQRCQAAISVTCPQ